MQLNVAVGTLGGMGGTQENWCACSHLHINLLITPTLIITLTHLHVLKFVPFRCFCYSCARLFIIASLERSSVYPSILQTWLKSFFKWKEIAIKGRVIVTWYLQGRGSYSASCSEAIQRFDWKEIAIKRRVSVHIYRSGEPQLGWLLPMLSSNRTRHGNAGDQYICQSLQIAFFAIFPNFLPICQNKLLSPENYRSLINLKWTPWIKLTLYTLSGNKDRQYFCISSLSLKAT